MNLDKKKIQGPVKVCLALMDDEIRLGENKTLLEKFRKLRADIRANAGASIDCLNYGTSEIIELDGMMFWVNRRERDGGTLNVFVSCRRATL